MENTITDFISSFFVQVGKNADVKHNFINEKTLDSIEFITLISEIEENYNITFTEEELQSPLFSSIEGIAQIVAAKL